MAFTYKPQTIAVYGLGYVGLPLSLSFSIQGLRVVGVDVNKNLVERLNSGETDLLEDYRDKTIQEILQEELKAGRFKAVADSALVPGDCRDIIITVGLPVHSGEPDFSHILSAAEMVGGHLRKGSLVLIRSTVVPGTTREQVKPVLEQVSGLTAGADFYLAYASERIAEGKAFVEFAEMPTVLAGIDEESRQRARQLLRLIAEGEIIESDSIEAVELAKVIENISRDINIAMVNEFAAMSRAMGLNPREVIGLANTHKRVNLLKPGPGVGGYCIPNAYHYLNPKARERGIRLFLAETARRVNDARPQAVVDLVAERLAASGRKLKGTKVAVLGLAMKDYSSDSRQSPALEIVKRLSALGLEVKAYDPEVKADSAFKADDLASCVAGAAGVLLLARQREFDQISWGPLAKGMARNPHPPFFLDTRGSDPDLSGSGLEYISI